MSALPFPHQRTPPCRLRFAGTSLRDASAGAPWRVVRARSLESRCEATLVQTRGGMLAGDRWSLDVDAGAGAAVRLSALSPTLAHRGVSFARTRLRVAENATLAWRSPGTIALQDARPRITTILDVAAGGRAAITELFAAAQPSDAVLRLVVVRSGSVVYEERTRFDRDPRAPWRLAEATHLGTALAVTPRARAVAARWHAVLRHRGGSATSPRPGLVLARALAGSLQELGATLDPLLDFIDL